MTSMVAWKACSRLGNYTFSGGRVTDPNLFHGVGLPPTDLLDDVARAWAAIGLAVNECFTAVAKVTGEWTYTAPAAGMDPCFNVKSRCIHSNKSSDVLAQMANGGNELDGSNG